MRISRPCYDKPWRCPGWAGGGIRLARVQRCDNGYVRPGREWDGSLRARWWFGRCDTCDVITLPYTVRWLDWRWWWEWKLVDLLWNKEP